MKFTFGKAELVLAALLLAYLLLNALPAAELLRIAVVLAICIAATVVFSRWLRYPVRSLLWKLRNRLIVAYVFMALVPIVLITLLFGLGGYLLGGQL